jgi:hypothetical protein
MKQFTLLICFALVACISAFTACRQNDKNTYAICDFSKNLQPYLTNIVSQGIVGYDLSTEFIKKYATDKELLQLSKSEHPVLRAIAFREMLERPTFNHFDLMMNNLDDTAIVATDAGEWGVHYFRVSDDMLINGGRWKDSTAKAKTIEEIILKHNFLTSAYQRAGWVAPDEKFYAAIRQMVQRERGMYDNYEQTEDALYALAKYKKQEDISLIKQMLLKHSWGSGEVSFELMATYPNEAYLEVYESYYPRNFYRKVIEDWPNAPTMAISFIKSIAVYKNQRSEKILDSILNRKPFMLCPTDTATIKRELTYAIWNNRCPAYEKLLKQVEHYKRRYEEDERRAGGGLPVDNVHYNNLKDSALEPVRWMY